MNAVTTEQIPMSGEMGRLEARRRHVAHLAERHALAMLEPSAANRDLISASLSQLTHEKDMLDKQIAWKNRRTGWAWPTEPAWRG